jgi:hypothetical protein
MTNPKILGINERWYPVGGSHGGQRSPVTAVLVAGAVGDYAVYCGVGGKEHAEDIAHYGDKLSFEEARAQFRIEESRYRT